MVYQSTGFWKPARSNMLQAEWNYRNPLPVPRCWVLAWNGCLFEEFGMTAQINENHVLFCYLVDQQEVTTNMTFAITGPVTG